MTVLPILPASSILSSPNRQQKNTSKIQRFFSSLFLCLSCQSKVSNIFTSREIALLRNDHSISRKKPSEKIPNLTDKLIINVKKEPEEERGVSYSKPTYTSYDESLESLREFMRNFSVLSVDILHKDQLEAPIKAFQMVAPSLPSAFKSIAKFLIEIGDKAAKPLFQKFSQQKTQVIDPALKKIFKTLLKEDLTFHQEGLLKNLEEKIYQQMKGSSLLRRQNINKDYIVPVLDWLLNSHLETPLTDRFLPASNYREEIIDKVFELAVTLLVERKIDHYATVLEKIMQGRLENIIHNMMSVNASHFSDFFSGRLAELVSSMSFTQTFDSFIHNTISPQIQGFLAAEKILNSHRLLLNKAEQTINHTPQDAQELDALLKAKKHLSSVEKYGGSESFLQQILLEEFSKHPSCSPKIAQIIQQQLTFYQQERDPVLAKKAGEKALFTSLAESFLVLMLPTRKKIGINGQIDEVDSLVELWDNLYFPDEFYDLTKHIEDLASEFITPETTALFSRIKEPLIDVLKNMFKTAAQDLLKKQLVVLIQKAFEKLTIPANLDELVATSILPIINTKLLKNFIAQELGINVKALAPFFYNLISQDSSQREGHIRSIQKELMKISKEKLNQFNGKDFYISEIGESPDTQLHFADISGVEWLNLTLPTILETEKMLLQTQFNGAPLDPKKITLNQIHETLTKNFQEPYQKNDSIYGDILMNLIFKVGEWPHENLIGFFIKDNISKSITSNIQPIRESHTYLIQTIADALKETFLDRAYAEKLLSSDCAPVYHFTQQKLAHQIDITSKIMHTFIMRMAESKGTLARFAIKKVLTDKPDEINKLLTKIYQKLFSNSILNENLIVKTCDELFKSLEPVQNL